jgi:expansin (peptidoglycan-binding protein)
LLTSATSYPHNPAANTAFYAKSAACGQCFEVRCTGSAYLANACVQGGSVVVEVTDQCPCAGNEGYCCDASLVHFDLSPGAFAKIADPGAGVISTQYRPVACPVQGQLQVKIKDGSNPWWFALLATNVGGSGAVTKIELSSGSTGAWVTPARQDYNYWLATSGSGFQFPLGVRVWQGTQNVTGTIPSMSAGATFSLSSNFGSTSPSSPSSTPSPSSIPSPSSTPSPQPAHDGGCFIPN